MKDYQKTIICLSGMPASGKDTVSERLCVLDGRFVLFKKHRGTNGKSKEGYFNISIAQFEKKIRNGDFVQWHGRYGRYYGIDGKELNNLLETRKIPIIHVGRIENFYSFKENLNRRKCNIKIFHVQLWETRECLSGRITNREKTQEEINKRLAAMEQEFDDALNIMNGEKCPFDIIIRNTDLDNTCLLIIKMINGDGVINNGYDEFKTYLRNYKR